MRASKLQPALLGGLVIGVLSALPVISMGNCLCCLWVVLGGMLATWLLQQNQPTAVEPVDGFLTGVLAGVAGAVIGTLVALPIQMLMGPMGNEALRRVLDQNGGDMPPEVRSALEQLTGGGVHGAFIAIGLIVSTVVNAVFGGLGGALGAVMFKPSMPPPPPPVPGFADDSRPHVPE
jgi:hypothetical protein